MFSICGKYQAAVSDFESAHKNFPDDETIANVLRYEGCHVNHEFMLKMQSLG